MNRRVKVVQYGCGNMGKILMRYVLDHGGELVGAYDRNEKNKGRKIGELIGLENQDLVVKSPEEFEADLKVLKPDVCIIATRSTMAEMEETMTICAKNGVNAITTGEEALYPWNSSPDISKKLDKLAKEKNCTITGSGYPDMYWGSLITTLAGSLNKITRIEGISSYNVEDYGKALAEGHGAGFTLEEFNRTVGAYNDYSYEEISKLIERGEYAPSYMWNQNGWLCEKMGLTITNQVQKCIPQIAERDVESKTLGKTIKKGEALGMSAIVTTETKEGITLETQCIGKVYLEEDFDRNDWKFVGQPTTEISVDQPNTVELTCANVVNSIPKLIDAEPGYITTNHMRPNVYMVEEMHKYVESK